MKPRLLGTAPLGLRCATTSRAWKPNLPLAALALAGCVTTDGVEPETERAAAAIQRALSTADAEHPARGLYDGTPLGTVAAPGNVGYRFAPLMDGFVTGLGGAWNATYPVRLYEGATGRVLATVSHRSTGPFAYTPIEPIAVTAGVPYVVAVMATGTVAREETAGRSRQRNHVQIECFANTTPGAGSGSGSGTPPMPTCASAAATVLVGMPDVQFTPSMLSDCEVVPHAADGNACAPWNEVRLGAMMDGDAFTQNNISPTARTRWVRGDFVKAGMTTAIVDDRAYAYAASAATEYFIDAPWPVSNAAFDTTVIDPGGARRTVRFGLSHAAAPVPIWSAGPTATFRSRKLSNLEQGVGWRQEHNYVPATGRANLTTTCACSDGGWVVGRANSIQESVGRCAKQACDTGAERWEPFYFDYRSSCAPGPLASIDADASYSYTGAGYSWGTVYQQDYSVQHVLETVSIRCDPQHAHTLGTCYEWDSPSGPRRIGTYQYCRVTRPSGATLDYCQIPESVSDKNVCQRYCQYMHGDLGNLQYGDDAAYDAWRNRPCTSAPAPDPVAQAYGGYAARSCTRSP